MTTEPKAPDVKPSAEKTAGAGQGAIALAAAKFYFLIAGWALYFSLPRILSEQQWGDYLLIVRLVSIVNNVVVAGTIQAVSRFTAQNEAVAGAVRWAAVRMHAMMGVSASLLFALAGLGLSFWWKDPGLAPLFGLVALVIALYSFYSVFVGSANGTRQFIKQAALDMGYATLKIGLIVGGAALTVGAAARVGVAGALSGMVAAAAIILTVSIVVVGKPDRKAEPVKVKPLARFAAELFLFTFILNLLLGADLILIKRMALQLAPAGQKAAAFASTLAGYYGTAQVFAFIPFQLLLALAFVIFPLLSRTTFDQDQETTRAYIKQTLRLAIIVAVGLSTVFASQPEAIISVVYQAPYRAGGIALRQLAWGIGCLSMMVICCTILNAAGRTRPAIITVLSTLILAVAGVAIALSTAQTPAQALQRAALGSATAMVAGFILSLVLVYKDFRASLNLITAVRVIACGGATFALGYFLPERGKLLTVAYCCGLVVVFVILLLVTGEIKKDDVGRLKSVFRRRKTSSG